MKAEIVYTVKGFPAVFTEIFEVEDMQMSTLKKAVNDMIADLGLSTDSGPAVLRELVSAIEIR